MDGDNNGTNGDNGDIFKIIIIKIIVPSTQILLFKKF